MRTPSRAVFVFAVVLALSVMNFPGLVRGQPSGLYPVTVTLSTGEKVFIAAHTSSLEGGNWIKLGGGSSVELPPLALSYEGPDSASYTRDGVTITIESLFGEGGTTYPIANHQVYSTGQPVSAKFWGAPALKGLTVDFKLLKLTSISEAREVAVEVFQGNLTPIRDKLDHPTWNQTKTLDGSGDASVTIPSQTAGSYLLVVVKEAGPPYELYVYSATVVEVVERTLPASAPTSVRKGYPLNVNTGVIGTYIHGAVLIKKSAYHGEIKLRSGGTVLSTELYLNGVLMADGAFIIDTEDFSYEDAILLLNKLKTVFGANQIAIGVNPFIGFISLPTSSLTPGDYVLLLGVYNPIGSKVVGVSQRTVTILSPTPPSPPPVIVNKSPVADAGPDQTVYVGDLTKFSGAKSRDPDGTIVSYEWDFGDGAKASGMNVSHAYSEPGSYTVTLTVKDNLGAKGKDTCVVTVREIPPPPKPAEFVVSHLSIKPEKIELGKEVTISFLVTNVGDEPGNYTVRVYIGLRYVLGDVYTLYEEEVTLEGGESKTVSYTVAPDLGGTYSVDVDGLKGTFAVIEFEFSDLVIFPGEVKEGGEVAVSVTVTNVGEETGTCTVDLDVDGAVWESKDVTLESGESTIVEFKVTAGLGSHTVRFDGLTGSFEVKQIPVPIWMRPEYIALVLTLIGAAIASYYTIYKGEYPRQTKDR